MDRKVDFDLENGKVIFAADPGGEVRADYTYYASATSPVNTMLVTEDDLVEFANAYVYVLPANTYIMTNDVRSHVFEQDGYGRVTTKVQWNKDSGILEWDTIGSIPVGRRIIAEYSYHTFKRLTDDGFGDLTFNDPVVVADSTPAYPDYTYADICIWNEGEAMLRTGQDDLRAAWLRHGWPRWSGLDPGRQKPTRPMRTSSIRSWTSTVPGTSSGARRMRPTIAWRAPFNSNFIWSRAAKDRRQRSFQPDGHRHPVLLEGTQLR